MEKLPVIMGERGVRRIEKRPRTAHDESMLLLQRLYLENERDKKETEKRVEGLLNSLHHAADDLHEKGHKELKKCSGPHMLGDALTFAVAAIGCAASGVLRMVMPKVNEIRQAYKEERMRDD